VYNTIQSGCHPKSIKGEERHEIGNPEKMGKGTP
jgi:hypothetical protein